MIVSYFGERGRAPGGDAPSDQPRVAERTDKKVHTFQLPRAPCDWKAVLRRVTQDASTGKIIKDENVEGMKREDAQGPLPVPDPLDTITHFYFRSEKSDKPPQKKSAWSWRSAGQEAGPSEDPFFMMEEIVDGSAEELAGGGLAQAA